MINKLLSGVVLSTLLLTSGGVAKASTTEVTDTEQVQVEIEVKAGIKPGSILYGLDKGWEKLILNFVGDEKEAELLIKYGEERLSELNELDEEKVEKYADELYQEYGTVIEKVSERLAERIANGEIESKIQVKLDRLAELDQAVDAKKVEQVSNEIKIRVNDHQTKTYALSIITGIDQTQVEDLKAQGYGYGEIIKLQAFAELSGKTIEELMFLDIYVTNEENVKEIDFGKLAIELGLVIENENGEVRPDLDAVKEQFKQYKDEVVKLRAELKQQSEEAKEAFKLEMEARLEAARQEMKVKIEAKLQERLTEFNQKIEEIYQTKVEMINQLDETVIRDDVKANLIIKLDEVKAELLASITEKVESGEVSPRDLGQLNAEIHTKFNEVFDEELSDEVKEEIKENFDDVINQIKPIFNQMIDRFETKYQVTLTEDQVNLIWLEIESKINDMDETDKAAILARLDVKVNEMLEKLLENQDQVTVNMNLIFEELLTSPMLQNRLSAEAYAEFEQELINAKAEIIANVEAGSEFTIRMELYQELIDRLETYLQDHNYTNPNAEAIFDKVINSTLFRITTRLNNEEFNLFKQELIDAKAEILAEIDLSKSNIQIEFQLTQEFNELLTEFKESVDTIEIVDTINE